MREYRISEDLFTRANLHATARLRRILLLSTSVLVALLWIVSPQRSEILPSLLLALAAIWAFFLLVAPALNRWQFRRIYRRNELLQQPQHFDMQDDLLHLRSSHGESRYRLQELKRVRLLPDMVLIYPATTFFHMIPRELLSEAEIECIRSYADEH